MNTETSLDTLKKMLESPLPKWQEIQYTILCDPAADEHQYVNTCDCECCSRIKTLKTLAGPMPFAPNTPVWITKYCSNNEWEQATFVGRDTPNSCNKTPMYCVQTSSGYSYRELAEIRSSPPKKNDPVTNDSTLYGSFFY